jgi:hypothetical protein
MDPYDAIAMWDEGHVDLSQQKVIKQYLRACLGKKIFIPDGNIREAITQNLVLPQYGSYEYLAAKSQQEKKRPEQMEHRAYDLGQQLCSEVEAIVNRKGGATELMPYNTPRGRGWTLLAGADHGKGAWRAHSINNTIKSWSLSSHTHFNFLNDEQWIPERKNSPTDPSIKNHTLCS